MSWAGAEPVAPLKPQPGEAYWCSPWCLVCSACVVTAEEQLSMEFICKKGCLDVFSPLLRFSLWFLHLRSAPRVTYLCVASRRFLQPRQPHITTSLRCHPLPRPRGPASTLTRLPPPSLRRLRPWSSCWAAATGTPPLPMQQRTPHRPPPGGTRLVVRNQSAACCTASRRHTSISSPLLPPTLV